MLDCPCQVLRFEGVDTVADIRLNGVLLAHVENMHRTFEFDVAGILKPGENWLEVKLYSPTRWIREKYAQSPADGSSDAMRGFANLRKAHCMFGWDWGPHLPDAGIWRPVSLLGVEGARLPSVQVRQHHQHGRVKLSIRPEPDYVTAQDITYTVELTDPQGQVATFEGSPAEILIEHPQLWWPPRLRGAAPVHPEGDRLLPGQGAGFLAAAHRPAHHDHRPGKGRARRKLRP